MNTPLARILVVEDDADLREAVVDTLTLAGHAVIAAGDGSEALSLITAHDDIALVLSDMRMPRMDGPELLRRVTAIRPALPVLLMTAYGTIEDAVRMLQDGAVDYLVKPFDPATLSEHVERYLRPVRRGGMIAEDPFSQRLVNLALRVAQSDSTVMITGPSGVGKEVLARFVHDNSARAKGPFVAINCAAIPENMLEAMLFGYEKGAFTGALAARAGTFEQAQGGTLLLDEVTEMDLGLQSKLLRVIQEREVERLGGRGPIALDVRLIATSNRDLRAAVRDGRFREDLYFRLNVFPLALPRLADRPGDILPLADALLARHAGDVKKPAPRLSNEARQGLLAHAWPGNVRELNNLMERALILHQGETIEKGDLLFENNALNDPGPVPAEYPQSRDDDAPAGLKAQEQDTILTTLRETGGRRDETAKRLGLSPRTLRYKLAKMRERGIPVPT
ncbi:MAG: sigma-54-dependent Fis family transcriptional regulator [Chromatiales bacterium]|nr:sigma-54-dependent Fis family transcriptional regulator [Gammaproteobacteria bacterium]MCP5352475.1 sigma-54-dependent Fis family transcriptional regulator [Chromatiales bacterium]